MKDLERRWRYSDYGIVALEVHDPRVVSSECPAGRSALASEGVVDGVLGAAFEAGAEGEEVHGEVPEEEAFAPFGGGEGEVWVEDLGAVHPSWARRGVGGMEGELSSY